MRQTRLRRARTAADQQGWPTHPSSIPARDERTSSCPGPIVSTNPPPLLGGRPTMSNDRLSPGASFLLLKVTVKAVVRLGALATAVAGLRAPASAEEARAEAKPTLSFNRDIRPI